MLGDGRASLQCYDGITRTGLIRGTMRRRVWINAGDIVLIGLREFQEDKADIIHKYSTDEARQLQVRSLIYVIVTLAYTHTHTYIHTYIYIHTYMYIYIYIYIYMYIHSLTHSLTHTYTSGVRRAPGHCED